ncbi:DUF6538 domain-containing protein [Sphingomonas silueang]|uniref:DUF6538 domain-containing protein n=1 Tax=Sphingomonas silueang TaxID=3156617 RepID=UPI0032B50081
MSHSVKLAKSKNEQFRMAVPRDIRHLVGKSEWTASLGTTDPVAAAARRGELTAFCKNEVLRLRGQLAQKPVNDALRLLDRGFERLATIRGSMDKAIAEQLALLASTVIDSWLPADQLGNPQDWGGMTVWEAPGDPEPVPSIDTEPEREIFRVRAALLEGTGKTDGILYRRLAALLLERRVFKPIRFAVSYMTSIEPKLKLDRDDVYEAVASAYLDRLAGHHFTSWPARAEAAVEPILSIPSPTGAAGVPDNAATPNPTTGLWAMPLSDALGYWKQHRIPRPSAISAATKSVLNFIDMFGDIAIGRITREIMIEYRNLVSDLPPQTELTKVRGSGRTLRQLAETTREARQRWDDGDRGMPFPDRLAPGSIKKDVSAIGWILGKIKADARRGVNVAEKIEIAGYSKTKKGQKTPRLPFTPDMMQTLFDSPLFTGCAGHGDAQRAKPGLHVYQDELYWSFLFGAVGGPRLGEIGQIALSDVKDVDLDRTFGGDFTGRCTFIHITGTGEGQHVKTDVSERYVVIRDRLIELGFRDYVEQRRRAGKTRLFDLEPDRNGNFVKRLSRRSNDYLDRVVTKDPRYVFHSTRHEFTDRAELSGMPTRVANSIKGHANQNEGDKYGQVTIRNQYVFLKNLQLDFIDWDRLKLAKASSPTG